MTNTEYVVIVPQPWWLFPFPRPWWWIHGLETMSIDALRMYMNSPLVSPLVTPALGEVMLEFIANHPDSAYKILYKL